jgi:hypothetical protein
MCRRRRRVPFQIRSALPVCFSLPRDHSVCFSDGATFVAGSFQAFVGDFRPKLFKHARRRFVRVPFGVIWCPRHFDHARDNSAQSACLGLTRSLLGAIQKESQRRLSVVRRCLH